MERKPGLFLQNWLLRADSADGKIRQLEALVYEGLIMETALKGRGDITDGGKLDDAILGTYPSDEFTQVQLTKLATDYTEWKAMRPGEAEKYMDPLLVKYIEKFKNEIASFRRAFYFS